MKNYYEGSFLNDSLVRSNKKNSIVFWVKQEVSKKDEQIVKLKNQLENEIFNNNQLSKKSEDR